MAYQQGQFMNTLMTRVNEARTTARGRLDQVKARVRGMGIGGGGLFKGIMPTRTTAGIKTFSQDFARPRMLDRFRQTRSAPTSQSSALVGPPRTPPGAPIMSYHPGAPVKTFAKENLRAIKTF